MRIPKASLWVAGWLAAAPGLVACSSGGESKGTVDRDEWKLVFTYDGAEIELPLESMDVYLVEDEDQYPEVFEIAGSGVALTGTFPMECHVGYDENWRVLFGRTITVDANGGARDDIISYVQMPDGSKAFVVSGSLVPEKVEGKMQGSEGDVTLSGTFTLRIRTALGEEEIAGRFAVHCLTWG
jgi:hypothetical protein